MRNLKLITLLLAAVLIMSMLFACGENSDTGATSADGDSGDAVAAEPIGEESVPEESAAEEIVPEETTEPIEPEPELEPIDPTLPYYEYLDEEFRRFGFTNGDWIVAETEAEVMDALRGKDCGRTSVDLSGQDVPFGYAFRYDVTRSSENFWDIAAELNFSANKTITQGDILAGVVWLRDAQGANPSEAHFAIKTPTNDWSGEGDMNISWLETPAEWTKIYFYGEFPVDENRASDALFTLFLGFEPHSIEIGGLYIMRFSSTSENTRATAKMPWY